MVTHKYPNDVTYVAVNVDVDWMDPEYSKSLPIVPHDMTSNQLWVHEQMCHLDNERLFLDVVKECKDQGWLAIYTRMVSVLTYNSMSTFTDGKSSLQAVLMCKANINNIQGRVLLQTLPSCA